MSKFKVGDRVRCIDNGGVPLNYTVGRDYTVAGIEYDRAGCLVHCVDDRGGVTGMFEKRFSPASTKPEMFHVGLRRAAGRVSDLSEPMTKEAALARAEKLVAHFGSAAGHAVLFLKATHEVTFDITPAAFTPAVYTPVIKEI